MDASVDETIETYEIQRLLRLLPHRYPFLMVDRIIEARGDEFGIGIKNVTVNEPQFQGHFPERPVMPGVLLIEGMAQTAGALCVASQGDKAKPAAQITPFIVGTYHDTYKKTPAGWRLAKRSFETLIARAS